LAQAIINAAPVRATIVTAGGGSSAISAIASTPGASRVFLEGRVLYDKRSFVDFLVQHQLPFTTPSPVDVHDDSLQHGSFCSQEAAIALSHAALKRSFELTPNLSLRRACIGVGCTSVLVSNQSHQGKERCHLAAIEANGTTNLYTCYLRQNSSNQPHCNRLEQEELVTNLLLYSILKKNTQDLEATILHSTIHFENPVKQIVEQITQGDSKCALLAPSSSNILAPLIHTVLPLDCLVFPGSFNPPHAGHMALARAAIRAIRHKRTNELENKKSTNCIEDKLQQNLAVDNLVPALVFELSITNADKPSMAVEEICRRIDLFGSLDMDLEENPMDWGVILTAAPLFAQKVDILSETISSAGHLPRIDEMPRLMSFVIGTDTMVRLIDPKYYGNSINNMLDSMHKMKAKGVHFVVGGRLEQGKDANER